MVTTPHSDIRHDWTRPEVEALMARPLLDLVFEAATLHRQHHRADEVQLSTLLSIKTGGCPEDCAYCPQSARFKTSVENEPLLDIEAVKASAKAARDSGSSRFCMGAAWRSPPSETRFKEVLDMVEEVKGLGLETCATLGMVNPDQARRLKDAGLDYYNHNLDTSPEFYGEIITTRTYEDRLKTLEAVREAGMNVCCGGILGLGEDESDRAGLLLSLATLNPHPESVPINTLVAVEGTPLGDVQAKKGGGATVEEFDWIRVIAVARIMMPKAYVRLSAGRTELSDGAHALAFLAGANSIFAGDRLLTTPNPGEDHDLSLLARLGLKPSPIQESGPEAPGVSCGADHSHGQPCSQGTSSPA